MKTIEFFDVEILTILESSHVQN